MFDIVGNCLLLWNILVTLELLVILLASCIILLRNDSAFINFIFVNIIYALVDFLVPNDLVILMGISDKMLVILNFLP